MIIIFLSFLVILSVGARDSTIYGKNKIRSARASVDNNEIILTHGQTRKITTKQPSLTYPTFLDPKVTVISSDSYPADTRYRPTIGNGHVANGVKNNGIFMNGLFNGYNVTSHRARIPSLLINSFKPADAKLCNKSCPFQTIYRLDVGTGVFIESQTAPGYKMELRQYAHRTIPQLLVTELTINNQQNKVLDVDLTVNRGKPSSDINFINTTEGDILYQNGITREPEYDITGLLHVTVISTIVPDRISVGPQKRERFLFLVSVDKKATVARQYFDEGVRLFMNQSLENLHRQGWSNIWKNGRIDLTGNKTLARITYAAYYYILSSLPLEENPDFVGLSPGDLAHGTYMKDYQGHVFWDQETWMYPPIQMLHDKIGKAIIMTRIRVLDAAKRYAAIRGYKGALFPWESALSGLDVCPSFESGFYEQHNTGDIALAIRQYLLMTNDLKFLVHQRGEETVKEIAKFWVSRVTYQNVSGLYGIFDIMPPDEWHWPVNNSAYTNAVAKLSLRLPKLISNLLNRAVDKEFEDIAAKMYIPFDDKLQYHPEYGSYLKNITVKQADVVLLGYPLMENMDVAVRRNDLDHYKNVTPGGPAMTWGMFAIGYLELDDVQNANAYFEKQLGNVVPPFNIWTEVIGGKGAVNFITGMGGYLQSLIFGYGGFRIYPGRLEFNGKLPPSITVFNITGVDYYGGSLDFSFSEAMMEIKQTKIASFDLKMVLDSSKSSKTLKIGRSQSYPNQRASIVPIPRSNECSYCEENSSSVVRVRSIIHVITLVFVIQHILQI